MLEDFIIKYCWSAVGLLIASIPVFFPQYAGTRHQREERKIQLDSSSSGASGMETARTGNRTQGFITNKRLMVGLADAGGRIMYSYKELSELAGYTSRVYNLIEVLNDLNSDKFVITSSSASQQQAATVISSIVPSATMLSSTLYKKPSTPQLEKFDIRDVKGSIEYGKQGMMDDKEK